MATEQERELRHMNIAMLTVLISGITIGSTLTTVVYALIR